MAEERILNLDDLIYFRFKKFNPDRYLITNDVGDYQFLDAAEFNSIRELPGKMTGELYQKLENLDFINNDRSKVSLIKNYRAKNDFLNEGPSLHIIVLTLRCDHACTYCQSSRKRMNASTFDMSLETAERVVDFIYQTTANNICIEFQGGEPLANFETLKHIVDYSQKKDSDKNVIYSVVTNLNQMNEDKLSYLLENRVSICTSLDGPEDVHNTHRKLSKGNSFNNCFNWIKRINEENLKRDNQNLKYNKINALLTVTPETLKNYKRIIDLYIELGFTSIHLRPVNPFGYGKRIEGTAQKVSADEFIDFYNKSMDYIIALNNSGTIFYEKTAQIFLKKIINKIDANFLDLRSPCGAGIGQLAYNYNGSIYTCDEGRMISAMGDHTFCLGNVADSQYREIVTNDIVRNLCIASCLEGLAGCNDCVYNPYCGVCPVYNYIQQGNIFGQIPTNERCKMYKGILDYLFLRIDDCYKLFSSWLELM